MKSKGIKNLLIDLGGVLINLDRQRCIENFQKLGLRNVEELLDISNQDGILMQQEKGLITPAEFRNGVREMIGKVVSDKQIDAAWNSFLVDIPTHKLDLLLKLREKYVVYLLSNASGDQNRGLALPLDGPSEHHGKGGRHHVQSGSANGLICF